MRTLKLAILASIIGLIPSIAVGQLENYPLQNFKLPLIKRASLNLGFLTNSDGLTGNVKYDSNLKTTTNQFHFNGQGSANWNYYFQSPKWQSTSVAYMNLIGITSTSKIDANSNTKSNNSSMYTSMYVNSSSLYYFQNKAFVSISPYESISYGRNKSTFSNDSSGQSIYSDVMYSNNLYSTSNLGLGVGYGRIEPIWDAHKMIFTLLDLKKEGRLLREPTNDEITAISQKLSSLKNERFFDDRLHTIKEVTALDSLLTSMGLTKAGDIGVSTAIYDNLGYAYTPQRFAGYRVWLEPNVGYKSGNSKLTGMSYSSFHQMVVGVNANATYEKPINIYWQRTLSFNASYVDNSVDTKNAAPSSKYTETEVQLSGAYGYYPNTRTHFNLEAGGRYSYINSDQTINTIPYRLKYGELFANGYFYYYLSPKIRIEASAEVTYKTNIDANTNLYLSAQNPANGLGLNDNFTTKELGYTFSATIKYALF